MRVLVVEDDPGVRQVCEDVVRHAGYEVIAAADFGGAAACLSHPELIDAVVTDVRLPGGGSGLDLADMASRAGIPVLLTTGHHESVVVLEGRGIPHLRKPFRIDRMLSWLARADAVQSRRNARPPA